LTLFAGIDGGQSSTVAAVGDSGGERGRGIGPPADLVGGPRDAARQAAAIEVALAAALEIAGFPAATRFAGLVAGITGFDEGISAIPDLNPFAERFAVVHDTAIAHAGAFGGAAGIVAIAGTGSVALGHGEPGSAFVRAGGWGYFFGDEGGAIWIARTALRRAMLRHDRGEGSDLEERALASFGAVSLREIQHGFAHGEIERPALAAFASDVLESAAAGDADAVAIRAAACAELAELVVTVDRRLAVSAARSVSYAGGLFENDAFVEVFRNSVAAAIPNASVNAPEQDPVGGAFVLARLLARAGTAP
jgi:N-acetylglucosamine kinase-like BadF-type ATPase